jgi:ribosomal protein S18 acetylase RimI-like enzyme
VMELSYALLRDRHCTRYLLEVLEANDAAAALYRSGGFVATRRLQCWLFESTVHSFDDSLEKLSSGAHDWSTRQAWWTVNPSWQNSTASIQRARDRPVVLGNDDGYALLFPSNGDLAQLAVRPGRRRQRLGTRLLHAAAAFAGKPLRIMNVDDDDEGIARFLELSGAKRTVRQIEMEREL